VPRWSDREAKQIYGKTSPERAKASANIQMTTIAFPDLVAKAYESAGDANELVAFVRDAADFFAAQQAAVAIWSEKNPNPFLPVTHGMNGKDVQVMFDNRGQAQTLFEKLGQLPNGKTFVSGPGTFATPSGASQHATTHTMHLLAGNVVNDAGNRYALLLFRDEQAGKFNQRDQKNLQNLMNYCQRAIELNNRFTRIFVENKAAHAALEYAPRGIIFLGQTGQVTYQNSAARMFLKRKDGLRLFKGSVRINDPEARKTFEEFIVKIGSAQEVDAPDSMICKIPRQSKAPPYQLIVAKTPVNAQRAALNVDELLAIAVIHNPDDLVDLNAKHLRTFYELSPAEARLSQALYRHNSLSKAARSLNISVNTARSELKNIFKKVGVKSQSALLVEFAKALKEV